jgi:hypothetical protein
MVNQSKVVGKMQDEPKGAAVFDRSVLAYHTMEDAALGAEILKLFLAQLATLERANWAAIDLAFEMHTLRGAAAAVGALQLQSLADGWRNRGEELEVAVKTAIRAFRKAARD